MPRCDPSPKLATTADPSIHREILAPAACEALRRAGLEAVARWEKEHGPFTEGELKHARRSVRLQMRKRSSRLRSA